jgi:hypothetical protein
VRVDPPLVGQRYGLGDKSIEILLLTPRLKGIEWPPTPGHWVPVHIARPLRPLDEASLVEANAVYELGWGEAYATIDDAQKSIAQTALRL